MLFRLEELFAEAVQRGEQKTIRDVIFLDEAHIFFDDNPDNIINTIAKEARKFGVALICISQSPTHFSEDFIAAVSTKVILGIDELYWKGSVYQPGANYTVTGPKTFTAVWEPVAKQATTTTSASGTPQKILPATGDPGSLLSLVGLGVAGFAGLLGLKRPRKN